MKRTVLNRYDRAPDDSIIIDVAATRAEDLYNNFDKNAPYIRRDLDQDLVDYLIGCVREVGAKPFVIRFTLTHSPDETRLVRIRRSVKNYFFYLIETEKQKMFRMFRKSAILLCIGLAILFASVWVNQWLGVERSVIANVFAEGLTVAAWVSLWEALAVFIIEWFPHRKNILFYRRLAQASLAFRSDIEKPARNG
jgi:hypothetical protein